MASGRFVNTSIAEDDRLGRLSAMAELIFLKTIPHLDRDGMITGKPGLLFSKTHPLREELFGQTQAFIDEWVAVGLVVLFNSAEGPVLFFPGFAKNNKLPHYERERPSRFPPPPGYQHDGKDGPLYPAHKTPPSKTPKKPKVDAAPSEDSQREPDDIVGNSSFGLDEVPELVQDEGMDEVQDTVLDEVRELLQDSVDELQDEVPFLGVQMNRIEVKDQYQVEEEKNECMNEYARVNDEHSFIHSLPSAQIDFDDCFELLTDPEVGLDEKGARDLAAKYTFELLERHVFAWLAERKSGGSFSMTGALIHRIKSKFSAPALSPEQKRSALYQRFHSDAGGGVYSIYNHLLRPLNEDDTP